MTVAITAGDPLLNLSMVAHEAISANASSAELESAALWASDLLERRR
jgi:hypothetical protein